MAKTSKIVSWLANRIFLIGVIGFAVVGIVYDVTYPFAVVILMILHCLNDVANSLKK